MKSYHKLLKDILERGEERTDRTKVGTTSLFGYQWRHDLSRGFPLLTTKKVHFKSVVVELLWFLQGRTNTQFLHEHGVTIWDEWANEIGELGPVYGKQWRAWATEPWDIDQISMLIQGLIQDPQSRRHIVSAWNPADIPDMALPPCHTLWQCYVSTDSRLSLSLYARSIDAFLGLPFNIASYALLVHLLARICSLKVGELIISFGDLHIYSNHVNQVAEQLSRMPRVLPQLTLSGEPKTLLEDIKPESIRLTGYDPYPAIKAPIAV